MKKKLSKDDVLNEQYINFVDNGKRFIFELGWRNFLNMYKTITFEKGFAW